MFEAFKQKDIKVGRIRKENSEYISSNNVQVFVKGSWDSYISPVSGKLIKDYQDRDRDMKENNCVDARELRPYGKEYISDNF